MNNKERLFWLSGIIFLSFFCINRIDSVEKLEILDRTNQFSYRLQLDQINELSQKLIEGKDSYYDRGFREGESHALLKSISGDSLYDYADGYHAALSQFTNENMPNIDKDTYSLFLDLLNMVESSDNEYHNLLNSLNNEK